MTATTTRDRLAALEPACSLADALALFDDLPAVAPAEIRGTWRGRELRTGHPMDGLLEVTGWYGKRFDDDESVHPLLFSTSSGEVVSVDPRRVPMGLAGRIPPAAVARARFAVDLLRPALRTRRPRARLRAVEKRGVVTAAMVYDHLPIIDFFRRVDDDTLLGLMDLRTHPQPYLFVLARDG